MNDATCDVAVIGGGPAGVAAVLAAHRAGARATLIEPLVVGGEAMNISEVEELPQFAPASGADFAAALMEHVLSEDIVLALGETVMSLDRAGASWLITTDSSQLSARAVILATGATPRRLPDMPDGAEQQVDVNGVFTCASCDAPQYAGRSVAVAGGGDTGAGAALALGAYATRVVLFERESELTCQDTLRRRVAELPNVERRFNTEVLGTARTGGSTAVRVAGPQGEGLEAVDGMMLAVGLRPRSALAAPHAALDVSGAVRVGPDLESSAPGLFAAGDVREASAWRCAAAWGDGLTSARSALNAVATAAR